MARLGLDASLATFLLLQRAFDVGVDALKPKEYWDLVDEVGDPGKLFGDSGAEFLSAWIASADVKERVRRRLDSARQVAFEREALEGKGIRIVTYFDDGYPERYRERLERPPALLYAIGPLELGSRGGVAIVGSRDVSADGAGVARAAAAWAARDGRLTISGGAKGVDRLAMDAALAAGGEVVGVLPASLLTVARDSSVRRAIHDERLLLLTPNSPSAGFSAGAAMGRNKLIYALSDVAFVVASDRETGGTWTGAKEAIERSIAPVAVWSGDGGGAGNDALVGLGAHAITEVAAIENVIREDLSAPEPLKSDGGRLFDLPPEPSKRRGAS